MKEVILNLINFNITILLATVAMYAIYISTIAHIAKKDKEEVLQLMLQYEEYNKKKERIK